MLNQLTINNYAIVDHLNLELKSGMSVVTGETGAGKSIMLDALGLTLGDRADKEVIRTGAKRADISACFTVTGNPRAEAWLLTNDFTGDDDGECILRRVLTIEGRSKAYINGQPTSLSELKALGEMLIDIHNQHEHQSLLKITTHQRLLDDYCNLSGLAAKVQTIYAQWHQLNHEIISIQRLSEDNNAQLQLISYQVKELEELDLGLNELAELEEEHNQLSHAEATLFSSHLVLDLCSDNESNNIQKSLNQALTALHDMPHQTKQVDIAEKLLNTALIQVEEASVELAQSIQAIDLNPERLNELDKRMADIHQLARKHKVSAAKLSSHFQELCQQLDGMSHSDEQLETLQLQLTTLVDEYHKQASSLTTRRKKGAKKLEQAIHGQLASLGMANTIFSLALNTKVEVPPNANGYERIEFLVSTNPGQKPRPMIKVASGGELSRISLAIQVVTAQTSAIPSLVFDEVDVGIGGGTAKAVGELLRQLGEKGQVLCVTHQPQVASQGHQHLFVSKISQQGSTSTQIVELDLKARTEEIARMLGGDQLSEESLAHAQEMMA